MKKNEVCFDCKKPLKEKKVQCIHCGNYLHPECIHHPLGIWRGAYCIYCMDLLDLDVVD